MSPESNCRTASDIVQRLKHVRGGVLADFFGVRCAKLLYCLSFDEAKATGMLRKNVDAKQWESAHTHRARARR
jgi:hypothetical protein